VFNDIINQLASFKADIFDFLINFADCLFVNTLS
jgi:hypothetical protein